MSLTINLNNKTVLITGGYGHLGKSIVISLLDNGAKVVVLGLSREKFDHAFPQTHENLEFEFCDISKTESVMEVFSKLSRSESADVLINNAYYSEGNSPEKLTDEEFSIGMDGTAMSVFRCIRQVVPIFKKRGSGSIINVSSIYGLVSPDFSVYEGSPQFLNPPHYGAGKAAILQLTRYYANYLGPLNIRVNAVTPGAFPSKEVQSNQRFIEALSSKTSLKRIGQPEEIAGIFTFLSSDAARYITGQNFIVDGGWTSR